MPSSAAKRNATAAAAPEQLDPPTFSSLPSDFLTNRSKYELWSIRLPADFDPSCLDGQEIELHNLPTATTTLAGGKKSEKGDNGITPANIGTIISSTFKDGKDVDHGLMLGHGAESAAYRILVDGSAAAKGGNSKKKQNKKKGTGEIDFGSDSSSSSESSDNSSDSDSDSDDRSDKPARKSTSSKKDDPAKLLKPLPTPFDRHIKLVQTPTGGSENWTDIALAPSAERAPKIQVDKRFNVKVAYAPVPQVKGLKRRWDPIGAKGGADKLGVRLERGRGGGDGVGTKKAKIEEVKVKTDIDADADMQIEPTSPKKDKKKKKKKRKKDKKKRKSKD